MPIRIYALAKELKVDSKELVELCAKAGIANKGSALASLNDEETERVRAYLNKGSSSSSSDRPAASGDSGSGTSPFTRDQYIPVGGGGAKPKFIQPKKSAQKTAAESVESETPDAAAEEVVAEAEVEPVADAEVSAGVEAEEVAASKVDAGDAESPQDAVAEAQSTEAAADAVASSAEAPPKEKKTKRKGGAGSPLGARAAAAASGDASMAPIRPSTTSERPIRNLSDPSKRRGGSAGNKRGNKPPEKKETVIRVAAIPEAPKSAPAAKSNEPKPQKPIMTLPADAIRSAKSGRAPLEQFTKQTESGRKAGRTGDGPDGGAEQGQATGGRGDRRRSRGGAERDEDGREKKMASMAGSRAARQQKRRRHQVDDDDGDNVRRRRNRLKRKGGTNTAAPRKGKVAVEVPCTVRSLSEATGVPTASIQRTLMQMGTMATINHELDEDLAELIAADLDMDVEFKQPATLEDQMLDRFDIEDDPADLEIRPPVITFLGHVDHGKTSLLDRIIGIDVVSGEAGGITQHIRAYKLNKDGREIAFVDTPGHEAFTEMRARGANVTDIAVLVVAADDGVMPQTEEAISHAKAANVPIIVAMNKCDLPGANPDKVYQDLSTHELLPAEWGGDVEVVKTSAMTGEGIDDLLEVLLLTAEIQEYKANSRRPATGVCLEAEQQGNLGVVAKVIVQNGTLSVGDKIVCGGAHGRVKALYDTLHPRKKLDAVGPSTPVNLVGLDIAPEAGDPFYEVDDIAEARQIAEQRRDVTRSRSLSTQTTRISFEEFQRRLEEGRLATSSDEVSTLNLIVRADVRGSIEAIQKELEKLDHPEVQIRVLQSTVGGITSADVTLADASEAVIVGFNVIPDETARALADERGVEIRRYDIIYKVTEDIKALLEGKLRPEERVIDLGRALVQRVFTISRLGAVAGCRVLAGTIERGCRIRVNRNGRGIGDYELDSLRREKDDAKEVREGFECGMKLTGFNDLKEGDILEAYKIEEIARTL